MARIRGMARIVSARSPPHNNTHVIGVMDGVGGQYAPPRGDDRWRTREDANPHSERTTDRANRRDHVCRQDGTSSRRCALGRVRCPDVALTWRARVECASGAAFRWNRYFALLQKKECWEFSKPLWSASVGSGVEMAWRLESMDDAFRELYQDRFRLTAAVCWRIVQRVFLVGEVVRGILVGVQIGWPRPLS